MTRFLPLCGAALLLAGALPVHAHVTLERREAQAGATYRAVLQINHGCSGKPTTAIRVSLPDGLVGARPMPKPGWSLEVKRGPYDRAYATGHGAPASEGVREISWSGGSLGDDSYDEFTFVARLADEAVPGATLYLPVVQECGETVRRWVDIPAAGADPHDLKSPAPGFVVRTAGETTAATRPTAIKAGDLTIEAPWTRATPGGAKVAGGYVRITNGGKAPDRLVGGSFAASGRVEVHSMSNDGGIMRMRPVEGGLEVKPGETVELKPGGYHLMFMELATPLKEGETVRGTLVFERAGTVEVSFRVGAVGAQGPGGHAHH